MSSSFLAGKPRVAEQGFKNAHLRRSLIPRRSTYTQSTPALLGI